MSGRVQTGILFILLGVAFALNQAGIINFIGLLVDWWPVIFIIIGVIQLVNRSFTTPVSGIIFILVGSVLLVNERLDINIWTFIWPIILIAIGLTFIFSRPSYEKNLVQEEQLTVKAFFSGTEMRSNATQFQGGTITTVFGGAEIDLREAQFDPQGAHLEITSVFGGVELIVPENVEVKIKGLPIFGGWEDVTRRKEQDATTLTLEIHAVTIFGGLEVKN